MGSKDEDATSRSKLLHPKSWDLAEKIQRKGKWMDPPFNAT